MPNMDGTGPRGGKYFGCLLRNRATGGGNLCWRNFASGAFVLAIIAGVVRFFAGQKISK